MTLVVVDEPKDRPAWIRETVVLLARRIREDRARLLARVAAASDEDLARGDDDDWGLGQIATHLLVVERGVLSIVLRLAHGERVDRGEGRTRPRQVRLRVPRRAGHDGDGAPSVLRRDELLRLAPHAARALCGAPRGDRDRHEERPLMPVSRGARFFIGAFNTAAAVALAAYSSAFPLQLVRGPELAFHVTTSWLAALAALAATAAIAFDLAVVGWVAVGYLLWIALLAGHALSLLYLALAVSLEPGVPRTEKSLSQGFAIAAITVVVLVLLREFA